MNTKSKILSLSSVLIFAIATQAQTYDAVYEYTDYHQYNPLPSITANSKYVGVGFMGITVEGANFSKSYFGEDTWFSGCSLKQADFSNTSFSFATVNELVDLENSNFSNSNLLWSSFSDDNLTGVNFSNATIQNVDFSVSDLKNTVWTGATINAVDLRGAKNVTTNIFANATSVKNVIGVDGVIKNIDFTDVQIDIWGWWERKFDASLPYVQLNSLAEMKNSQLGLTDKLIIKSSGKLSVQEDSSIFITYAYDLEASDSSSWNASSIYIESGGELEKQSADAKLILSLGLIKVEDGNNIEDIKLTLLEWEEGAYQDFDVSDVEIEYVYDSAEDLDEGFVLAKNYNWVIQQSGNSLVAVVVPEPSEYAILFGLIVLLFVYFRRRK